MRIISLSALCIFTLFLGLRAVYALDVPLSCIAETDLPDSIENGIIQLSPSRLLIASDDRLTVWDRAVGELEERIWPDEIIAAFQVPDGALIVSRSNITKFYEAGHQVIIATFPENDPNENQTLLPPPPISEIEAKLVTPDIILVQLEDRSIIFRISDQKLINLWNVTLEESFPFAEDKLKYRNIVIATDYLTQQVIDLERFQVHKMEANSIFSVKISGNLLIINSFKEQDNYFRIFNRDNGEFFDVTNRIITADPVFGRTLDGKILYGPRDTPLSVLHIIDPVKKELFPIEGNFGKLISSEDGTDWILLYTDAIASESPVSNQFQVFQSPPDTQFFQALFIAPGKVLATTSAGLLLANVDTIESQLISQGKIITPIFRENNGQWITASETEILIYKLDGNLIKIPHKLKGISNIKMAPGNVGFAFGINGTLRFDVEARTGQFFPAEGDESVSFNSSINLVDENVFITSSSNVDILNIFKDGVRSKKSFPRGFRLKGSQKLANGKYAFRGSDKILIFDRENLSFRSAHGKSLSRRHILSIVPDYYFVSDGETLEEIIFGKVLEEKTLINKQSIENLPPHDLPVEVRWRFSHPCRTALSVFNPMMRITNEGDGKATEVKLQISRLPNDKGNIIIGAANATFDTTGSWQIDVVADIDDEDVVLASEEVQISASWRDIVANWWKFTASAAVVVYVVAFALLFYLSHYRSWALRVMTDPVWAKIAIWPFFILRHSTFAQKWALATYFGPLRELLQREPENYLPVMAVHSSQGSEDASRLLNHFANRDLLWLQGAPGMGKSIVFRTWLHHYFVDHQNLSSAFKTYDFILIPILIRDYASLPERPDQRSDWFVEVIRRQLSTNGIRIDDISLLKAMLLSGRFALALDGLNEANRDLALAEFTAAYPRVKIIATCQSLPIPGFELWALPKTIEACRQGLLRLWLGKDAGDQVDAQLKMQGATNFLISGYDVRLIADLASSTSGSVGRIRSRIDLYLAALDLATDEVGEKMDLSALMRIAWQMLIDGRRHLSADEQETLGANSIQRLSADGTRILRQLGDRYEFRHDQMRSFLAALQLVNESPNIQAVINRLDDNPLWQCARKDQEELWLFVADLLNAKDLNTLWQAMLPDPSRAWAQTALHSRAMRDGISLSVDSEKASVH